MPAAVSLQQYDAQRDVVIRRSRDMQKAAKTAIYCLHRGDGPGADRDLALVEAAAAELQPIIDAEPTLRQGGFSASIEEYAGARRRRRRGVLALRGVCRPCRGCNLQVLFGHGLPHALRLAAFGDA